MGHISSTFCCLWNFSLLFIKCSFSFNPHLRAFFHCFLEKEGLERGKGRKRGKQQSVAFLDLSKCARTGDQTRNPGTCPDWELKPRPFGLQDNARPTESRWPGLTFLF